MERACVSGAQLLGCRITSSVIATSDEAPGTFCSARATFSAFYKASTVTYVLLRFSHNSALSSPRAAPASHRCVPDVACNVICAPVCRRSICQRRVCS